MSDETQLFFSRYAELYMAGDAEATADLCDIPFIAVRNGVAIHLMDREAVVGHLATNMAAYQAAGAASADIVGIDVLEQGGGATLATVHWQVVATDGRVVRDFRTSYQLVVADPWRILSYVNHDQVERSASRV